MITLVFTPGVLRRSNRKKRIWNQKYGKESKVDPEVGSAAQKKREKTNF